MFVPFRVGDFGDVVKFPRAAEIVPAGAFPPLKLSNLIN